MEGPQFLDWLAQVDAEGDGWVVRPAVDVEEPAADVQELAVEDIEPEYDTEDEGIESDAYGDLQENCKSINNTLSTAMDPRYCISSAFVSVYSVYGEEFRLCEICYISYSRRVPGEHLHRNTHQTATILGDFSNYICECCQIPMYQVTRVEVCNICNSKL